MEIPLPKTPLQNRSTFPWAGLSGLGLGSLKTEDQRHQGLGQGMVVIPTGSYSGNQMMLGSVPSSKVFFNQFKCWHKSSGLCWDYKFGKDERF